MQTLHQEVTDALATIFGNHPYTATFTSDNSLIEVTVAYQDYLTPHTMHGLLSLAGLSVGWDVERTMSNTLLHQLLEELFHHPERLSSNPIYRGNVRRYVFDRFATTDFKSEYVNES